MSDDLEKRKLEYEHLALLGDAVRKQIELLFTTLIENLEIPKWVALFSRGYKAITPKSKRMYERRYIRNTHKSNRSKR